MPQRVIENEKQKHWKVVAKCCDVSMGRNHILRHLANVERHISTTFPYTHYKFYNHPMLKMCMCVCIPSFINIECRHQHLRASTYIYTFSKHYLQNAPATFFAQSTNKIDVYVSLWWEPQSNRRQSLFHWGKWRRRTTGNNNDPSSRYMGDSRTSITHTQLHNAKEPWINHGQCLLRSVKLLLLLLLFLFILKTWMHIFFPVSPCYLSWFT